MSECRTDRFCARAWRVALLFGAVLTLAGCPDHPIPPVILSECLSLTAADAGDQCTGGDNEPNDTIPMAQSAPTAACDLVSVGGNIGMADVDMFHFTGFICDQAPAPRLHHDASNTEACLFLQCSTGSTGFSSCSGDAGTVAGTPKRLPNGLMGCCLDEEGDLEVSVSCSNTQGAIDGYVVVTGRGGACASYQMGYHL